MSKEKNNLELLFKNILKKTQELRKKNPKLDGQKFWQPIKEILTQFDDLPAKEWRKISEQSTKQIMDLIEYCVDGHEKIIMNEKNHFIIQQVRIPLKEKPSIRKIIQIVLNIGQYRGIGAGYHINFNGINDFLHKDDIINLSKYITDDIVKQINKYFDSL